MSAGRRCLVCGCLLQGRRPDAVYCSAAHRSEARRLGVTQATLEEVTFRHSTRRRCEVCGAFRLGDLGAGKRTRLACATGDPLEGIQGT